jgi:hypothetical protein
MLRDASHARYRTARATSACTTEHHPDVCFQPRRRSASSSSSALEAWISPRPPSVTCDLRFLGATLQAPAEVRALDRAARQRRDECIGEQSGHQGKDALLNQVDGKLVTRLGPRRRAGTCGVLERLVEAEADVGVHERGKWPSQVCRRHDSSNDSSDGPRDVMHGHVASPVVAVRIFQTEQAAECVSRNVRIRPLRELLLEVRDRSHCRSASDP